MIAVRYTEGIIRTKLASDIVTLGFAPPPPSSLPFEPVIVNAGSGISNNYNNSGNNSSTVSNSTAVRTNGSKETKEVETESSTKFRQDELGFLNFSGRFRAKRTFGLTSDISGDTFLLAKETNVPGFLGASQGRFESDSDYSTHIFSEIVNELPITVFSLVFTENWGTLTLGGPDPVFHSKPITWINTIKGEAGWVTHLSSQIDIYAKDSDPKTTPESDTGYVRTNLDRVWFDSGTTYIWGDERAIVPLNEWMGADPVTGQISSPYNITATNPTGKAVVPGIHKILEQEVKELIELDVTKTSDASFSTF
ncbi:hypothetical protein BGZ97_007735 [Linnemannia gamsii]|uniref:Peptidase A1 domain-containing protein n=1 Tax=Linnemannia gamsii TaxID=64522 RepID=A0A9P6RE57_9FUNG|nr:hypothetical protein BGZ97_007735 [Linnemannia gamsii]